MFDRTLIREGMVVRTEDGKRLGKVAALTTDGFIIEKGLLFKEDYTASFERVIDVRGDEVIYMPLTAEQAEGTFAGEAKAEDVRIPLAEEELIAEKSRAKTGKVRVTKDVVTEKKQVTVPVMREEVKVERVPVAPGERRAGDVELKRDEVSVPVYEEEIEVKKRPVVREEVRVHKERVQEQRTATGKVRREEAHIEDEQGRTRDKVEEREPILGAPGRDDDLYKK